MTGAAKARFRGMLPKLALLAITMMIGLFGMEILVRAFMPQFNPRNQIIFHFNEDGAVLGQPLLTTKQGTPKGDFNMTVSFNRHGYRDTKDFTQSTTNDVFVVGDSFSIGWGVEENERYSNLLEPQMRVPVYNIAMPEEIRGYGRTIAHVQKQGVKIRNMIIGICMENDLWDYTQTESTHLIYQRQMIRGVRHKMAFWFKQRSALWVCLSHTLQKNPVLRGFFEKIGIARNIDQLTHKNDPSPIVLETSRDELLKIATNYNSVVLIIPSRALWYGNHREVEERVHNQFVTSLHAAGLKVLDMKPEFEKAGDPLSFYFKSDPHWNVRGHAAAAQALLRFFSETEGWKQFLRSGTVGAAP
jgi:hypothetical protein